MATLAPVRMWLLFCMCLIAAACVAHSEQRRVPDLNYSGDFNGVTFKSGKPGPADSLEEAVSDADQIYWLRADIGVTKIPGGILRIRGFTDNRECSGVACNELSLRRAKIVYDWLVARGVPKDQLKIPEGRGNSLQLNDNSTEEKRKINRRTEVDLVL